MKIEYDGRRYLGDEQWIEEYVTKHLDDLLRDRTRITKVHRALHAEADFVRLFRETEPELYTRVTWEYRALCRAEELEPGNTTQGRNSPLKNGKPSSSGTENAPWNATVSRPKIAWLW